MQASLNNFNSNHMHHDDHHKSPSSNHQNHLLICTNNLASTVASSGSNIPSTAPTVRIITASNGGQTTPIAYLTSPNVIFDYNNSDTSLNPANTSQLVFITNANNDHYSVLHVLPTQPPSETTESNAQSNTNEDDSPNLTVNNHQTHGNLNINMNSNQFELYSSSSSFASSSSAVS